MSGNGDAGPVRCGADFIIWIFPLGMDKFIPARERCGAWCRWTTRLRTGIAGERGGSAIRGAVRQPPRRAQAWTALRGSVPHLKR